MIRFNCTDLFNYISIMTIFCLRQIVKFLFGSSLPFYEIYLVGNNYELYVYRRDIYGYRRDIYVYRRDIYVYRRDI